MADKNTDNLHKRILLISAEIPSFEKDGHNDHFNYDFTSIQSIVSALKPHCVTHGVVLVQNVIQCTQVPSNNKDKDILTRVCVETIAINADKPDEQLTIKTYGDGHDKLDKGPYKAISGARKYGIFSMFNLMSGDDDPEYNRQAKPTQRRAATKSKLPASSANSTKLRALVFGDIEWPITKTFKDKTSEVKPWFPENCKPEWGSSKPITDNQKKLIAKLFKDKGYETSRKELLQVLYQIWDIPFEKYSKHISIKAMNMGLSNWLINALQAVKIKDPSTPVPWATAPNSDDDLAPDTGGPALEDEPTDEEDIELSPEIPLEDDDFL